MQQSSLLHRCLSLRRLVESRSQLLRNAALIFILTCVISALLPAPVGAQLATQRQWVAFRQSDGLLSSDVFTVLPVRDAVWFGTRQGVSRYDGHWESYPTSAIFNTIDLQRGNAAPGVIKAMAASSRNGYVWIGTDNGYVSEWDGTRWRLVAKIGFAVKDMLEIEGVLWLATENGIYLFDGARLTTVPGLELRTVNDLTVDGPVVWLGADNGLWRIAADATDLEWVALPVIDGAVLDARNISTLASADRSLAHPLTGPIQALWSDGNGKLWIGAGSEVVQFNVKLNLGKVFQPFADIGHATVVTAIAGTSGQRVWIASDNAGVVQYMLHDGVLAAASNLGSSAGGGLETDSIRSVAIDQDNTVWFASPAGVFRYQLWAWLGTDSQFESPVVNDLLYDRNGILWVATGGEGIQRRDGLYATPVTYYPGEADLPSAFVNDLEQDDRGVIWAATAAGLAVFQDGRWSTSPVNADLPSRMVEVLQADSEGLWIGTSFGLAYYRFDDGSVRTVSNFLSKWISRLQRDNLGQIWLVTNEGGLFVRNQYGEWKPPRRVGPGAPSADQVTALLVDDSHAGGMYVAFLNSGIYHWNGTSWSSVDQHRWPRGDRIYALDRERNGNSIWIGSEIGLSRLDSLDLITYDLHDGMVNGAIRAIVHGADDGFWFGGQKGISFYQDELTPPWLRLTTINDQPAGSARDAVQVFATKPVQVSYAVGDLQSSSGELKVFYRLHHQGPVASWQEAGAAPLVLPALAVGTVDLDLKVRDQSFNYSPVVTRRLSVVAPPTLIDLPVLGEVESRVFQLLLFFGSLWLFGFGYVFYEIASRHHRASDALRRGFNPYISGEPVRSQQMFYGRRDLLDRIVATLHNNSIMIHGERRIGKTTLLYQLANALRHVQDARYWFLPVLIDLEGTTEDQLFLQLGEDISHMVLALPHLSPAALESMHYLLCRHSIDAAAGRGIAPVYTDREFGRDLRTIIRVLEQYCEEHQGGRQLRLILLMDEMDTLSQFNHIYQQQLRRIFMRDFAATLGAVVAGIAISKEWDRIESPWFNLFNEIAMQPFTDDDAVALLVEPVRGIYRYDPRALSFILERCDGRPYRIQQYALEAVNHMLKHKRRRILLVDVEYAHQQILTTIVNGQVAGEFHTDVPSAKANPTTGDVSPSGEQPLGSRSHRKPRLKPAAASSSGH